MDEPDLDVIDLLARLRAGDDVAVEELLSRYTNRLKALAIARLRRHPQAQNDASDVVQEMWNSVVTRLREGQIGGEPTDSQALWRLLAAITARKCQNRLKYWSRICRAGAVALNHDELPSDESAVIDTVEAAEFSGLIEQFLANLDPSVAKVAALRLGGASVAEIAAQTQTSESTVARRLRDVRERLRDLLER
jgi:RNA polymerase sigma factor (sigma-70 family)